MRLTEEYIERLKLLKEGELGLLRTHAFQRLDESLQAFDLFTGMYWPLREKNQFAPRREVAWLIAKLYAFRPLENSSGETISLQLRRCQPFEEKKQNRFREKFDELLTTPLDSIEMPLRWALNEISSHQNVTSKIDWVKLTDDLSRWESESKRLKWAKEYFNTIHNSIQEEKVQC